MKNIYKCLYLFIIIITINNQVFSQCYNNNGNACGSGATGTKYITMDPTNATDSWNSRMWNYYYNNSWSDNNNYVDWYCSYPGTVYEIAMDGYTNDEVTITKYDGSERREYDNNNNGDGEIATYTCPTAGYYRIRLSRQGGCCSWSSCESYYGWAWIRIRIKNIPCAVTPTYGINEWNGYVYDGTGPDYLYGAIGTQP